MWSVDQVWGRAGLFHTHMMVYAPNYDNGMLGGNEIGGHLPAIFDDAGTPFAAVVIPVDDKLAFKAHPYLGLRALLVTSLAPVTETPRCRAPFSPHPPPRISP